jgi:hypothetical protein
MSHIYKVFEHLKQLWMGIWQHTHTVTTTEVSPDLGKFAEIVTTTDASPDLGEFAEILDDYVWK